MSDAEPSPPPLRPLWMLATGTVAGAIAAIAVTEAGPPIAAKSLVLLGIAAVAAALTDRSPRRAVLWGMAGLAIAGGRGLEAAADRAALQRLMEVESAIVRVRLAVHGGWSESRWGHRARVTVLGAAARGDPVSLPRRCWVEVRGGAAASGLPAAGAVVDAVVRPVGEPARPLLVIASPRLLQPTGTERLVPAVRDRLARALLSAAGPDADRIRAAETAAALALGRRDLVPRERQQRWRRSGFAHLLAVSGLHVGIVGGAAYLLAALAGAGPRLTRLVALVAVPSYAVLAGASPSAMRAALMAVVFLGARFLGRAVLPMAAVLLAATILVIAEPAVVADAGFQLTVLITAALVRWVPPLVAVLPGPTWLTGAVAVPVVAQAAAVPIVAWHFRSMIPGALAANLVALPLLAPAVLLAVAATVLAAFSNAACALALDGLHVVIHLLAAAGAAGRALELLPPAPPVWVLVSLAACAWWSLQRRPTAVVAAAIWIAGVAGLYGHALIPSRGDGPAVELLPVRDGAAILLTADRTSVLFDAGRYPDEAAELLADRGIRRLAAAIASHTDEDHMGGLVRVLNTLEVEQLLVPCWMASAREGVPLLRAARRRGTAVLPVAAGTVIALRPMLLEVVWPPARDPPWSENERSLVVRARLGTGAVVATADIGRASERRLPAGGRLRSQILVVPHHGSRDATSEALLAAVQPLIALIPAAPSNTHGHPHPEIVDRLRRHGVLVRKPSETAACGARWDGTRWRPFP